MKNWYFDHVRLQVATITVLHNTYLNNFIINLKLPSHLCQLAASGPGKTSRHQKSQSPLILPLTHSEKENSTVDLLDNYEYSY